MVQKVVQYTASGYSGRFNMKFYAYFALLVAGAVGISASPFEIPPLGPDIDVPGTQKLERFQDFSDFVNKLKIPHTYDAVTEYLRKSPAELEKIVSNQNPGLTPTLEKLNFPKPNGDQNDKDDFLNSQHITAFRRSGPIEDHTISYELQLPKEDVPSPNSKSESYHFASSAVASSNSPGLLHLEWGSNKRNGLDAPVVDSGSKDFVLKPQETDLHVIFDKLYGNKDLPKILNIDVSGKPVDNNSAVVSSLNNRFIAEEFVSPNKDDNVKESHFSSQSSHSFSYQGGSIHS